MAVTVFAGTLPGKLIPLAPDARNSKIVMYILTLKHYLQAWNCERRLSHVVLSCFAVGKENTQRKQKSHLDTSETWHSGFEPWAAQIQPSFVYLWLITFFVYQQYLGLSFTERFVHRNCTGNCVNICLQRSWEAEDEILALFTCILGWKCIEVPNVGAFAHQPMNYMVVEPVVLFLISGECFIFPSYSPWMVTVEYNFFLGAYWQSQLRILEKEVPCKTNKQTNSFFFCFGFEKKIKKMQIFVPFKKQILKVVEGHL